MSVAIHLDDRSIEAIARQLFELLRGEGVGGERIDAAETARRFGVSRDYIYEHADELGAVKLSDSPKARLRFDPVIVAERLSARPRHSVETPQRSGKRPVYRAGSVDLLPIKGESP